MLGRGVVSIVNEGLDSRNALREKPRMDHMSFC